MIDIGTNSLLRLPSAVMPDFQDQGFNLTPG